MAPHLRTIAPAESSISSFLVNLFLKGRRVALQYEPASQASAVPENCQPYAEAHENFAPW